MLFLVRVVGNYVRYSLILNSDEVTLVIDFSPELNSSRSEDVSLSKDTFACLDRHIVLNDPQRFQASTPN